MTTDRAVVLVGGQAVLTWAQRLGLVVPGSDAGLLSSKDIDFEGSGQAARRAANLLGGSIRVPDIDDHTPNTGVVVFVDSGGVTRKIDFVGTPLGLRAQDVRDTAVRVTAADGVGVWVMHPERCMESRICNMQILLRGDDHAMGSLTVGIDPFVAVLVDDDRLPQAFRERRYPQMRDRLSDRRCRSA